MKQMIDAVFDFGMTPAEGNVHKNGASNIKTVVERLDQSMFTDQEFNL